MRFGRRRHARLEEQERFRARHRYLREDVTVYGEQLRALHVDTLVAELDAGTQDLYRHALESYERAKAGLAAAEDAAALEPVVTALVDGRFQTACVLAAAEGEPMPQRLSECFFNPQHGPSSTEVLWTPPGGTGRSVAVCSADANRLAAGEGPAVRMVRVGDRWVPSFGGRDSSYFPNLMDPDAVTNGGKHARNQAMMLSAMPTGGEGGIGINQSGYPS